MGRNLRPTPLNLRARPSRYKPPNLRNHKTHDEPHRQRFAGTVRDARIVFETVMRIANADDVPRWVPGNEFEEEWRALYKRSEN